MEDLASESIPQDTGDVQQLYLVMDSCFIAETD